MAFVRKGEFGLGNIGVELQRSVCIGVEPKVIFAWLGSYGAPGVIVPSGGMSFGMGVGSSDNQQFSVNRSSLDGVAASRAWAAWRRGDLVVQSYYEDGPSDPDGFLNWGIVCLYDGGGDFNYNNSPNVLFTHYLAVGGDDVEAAAVSWTFTGTGNKSVSSLSFQPDIVFHFFNQAGNSSNGGSGFPFASGFGAMSASAQFVLTSESGSLVNPSNSRRIHRTDRCIHDLPPNGGANTLSAEYVSMNANGFTIGVLATSGTTRVFSIALKGPFELGTFSNGGGASQSISGLGLTPTAGVLFSGHAPVGTSPVNDAKLAYSGFDTLRQAAASHADIDAVSPTQVHTVQATDALFIKLDGTTIGAQASYAGSSAGQLDIDWDIQDASAFDISYLFVDGTQIQDDDAAEGLARITQVAIELLVPSTLDTPETTPACESLPIHETPIVCEATLFDKNGTLTSHTRMGRVATCNEQLLSKSGTLVRPC